MKTTKTKKTGLYLTLFMAHSLAASAAVDIKTAALVEQVTDWTSKDQSFSLVRQYSSRRLKVGLFGFGWCSNIEDSLTANPDGSLTLRTCNDPQEETFTRQPSSGGQVVRFLNPRKDSTIILSLGRYELSREDLSAGKFYFNSEGNWLGFSKNNQYVNLDRSSKPWVLQVNEETFILDMNGQYIERIKASHQIWRYRYDQLQLKEITKSPLETVRYEYDEFKNLTSMKGPGLWKSYTYNSEKDQILTVLDGECIERYSYSQGENYHLQLLVDLNFTCEGRSPVHIRYRFDSLISGELKLKSAVASGKGFDFSIAYDSQEKINLNKFKSSIKSKEAI